MGFSFSAPLIQRQIGITNSLKAVAASTLSFQLVLSGLFKDGSGLAGKCVQFLVELTSDDVWWDLRSNNKERIKVQSFSVHLQQPRVIW